MQDRGLYTWYTNPMSNDWASSNEQNKIKKESWIFLQTKIEN
jgi:hypothetical protein